MVTTLLSGAAGRLNLRVEVWVEIARIDYRGRVPALPRTDRLLTTLTRTVGQATFQRGLRYADDGAVLDWE